MSSKDEMSANAAEHKFEQSTDTSATATSTSTTSVTDTPTTQSPRQIVGGSGGDSGGEAEECPICCSEPESYRRACGHGACASCWERHCLASFNKRGGANAYIQGTGVPCLGSHASPNFLSAEEMGKVQGAALTKRVALALATIPHTVAPKTLAEMRYEYNANEELRGIDTGEPYIFVSQRHYDALGECVIEHIFQAMERVGLKRVCIPEGKQETKEPCSKIFMSPDALTAETVVVLIHGSGAVRAGMWARALCINDNLKVGSMIPYIENCLRRRWGVIVLNCNENAVVPLTEEQKKVDAGGPQAVREYFLQATKPDLTPDYRKKGAAIIKCSEDPVTHTLYVFDTFIAKASASNIFIVAHSAGGVCTTRLMNERTKALLPRLKGIAFTDSVHSVGINDNKKVKAFMRSGAVCNWAQSKLPLDTVMPGTKSDCRNVSAGHAIHEWTSSSCMTSVFSFLEARLEA